MNKLLFICSRTTNDENRGVIAVQDVFIIDGADVGNNRFNSSILKDLYIYSAIKDIYSAKELEAKIKECEDYIGVPNYYNYQNIRFKCKTELEQYYDSIVCFNDKLEVIDFNFHKDK